MFSLLIIINPHFIIIFLLCSISKNILENSLYRASYCSQLCVCVCIYCSSATGVGCTLNLFLHTKIYFLLSVNGHFLCPWNWTFGLRCTNFYFCCFQTNLTIQISNFSPMRSNMSFCLRIYFYLVYEVLIFLVYHIFIWAYLFFKEHF